MKNENRCGKRFDKKTLLALLLILLLALGSFGCSKDDEEQTDPNDGDNISLDGEEGDQDGDGAGEGDQSGEAVQAEYDQKVKEDAGDIKESDYAAGDMESGFDFGFSVGKSFGLSGAVKKVDYSDISALASVMETNLQAAVASALGNNYDVFSDYEDDEEDDIDKLAYAIAMEDNDAEARYLEGGVYHKSDGKHYQYIAFCSANYYEVNSSDIDTIIAEAKSAMGITLPKSRLTKAIEITFDNAAEAKDYYSLYQTQALKSGDYTETVKVTVEGVCLEDGSDTVGYYVYLERERCYN